MNASETSVEQDDDSGKGSAEGSAPSSSAGTGQAHAQTTTDGPIDSTHVFILWWKHLAAAARFKDPSQVAFSGGLGELDPMVWQTGFEDLQRTWVSGGMEVESYPLIVRHLSSSEIGS